MIPKHLAAIVFVLGTLFTSVVRAEVTREGEWPETDPDVTLSVTNLPRAEAVKKLAEAAKWSVVVELPLGNPVDVHVKKQPAGKVLELLLGDGHYVAKRDGDLISIHKADESVSPAAPPASAEPVAPTPPTPPTPPAPSASGGSRVVDARKGEDLFVTGGSTRIEKDQVVKDLMVMGGSAEVYGRVTGDVAVMGGSATLKPGSHVEGDLAAIGGSIDVEDGAKVDGNVGTVGGRVRRDGKEEGGGVRLGKGELAAASVGSVLRDVGGAITSSALLFVFGAVLLALATRRMDAMQGEVATRPMRSFALGVVGMIVALIAFIALCVTIIGIPIAVVGLILAILGSYAGICAVLTTAGAALVRHRSKSPYVHLAVGCLAFLVLGAIPFIGGFVTLAVVLLGFGVMVATRGAGVFAKKPPNGEPYRTAAA